MTDFSQHSRQIMIWGEENQSKIFSTSALILGSGILGQMTLGCLAGLGVGKIVLMDNSRSSIGDKNFMFPELPYEGLKKAEKIEKISKKINKSIEIRCFHSKFSRSLLEFIEFDPDFIIDTQNFHLEKENSLDYAVSHKKEYISAYCNCSKSLISRLKDDNITEILDDCELIRECITQGGVPAGVAAGVIADELRKSLFSLDDFDNFLESRFVYNLSSNEFTRLNSDIKIGKERDKKVLVVGAGAIGNYVAMNLAIEGFREIHILDFDKIEYHNLSRQILLYDKVGEYKSEVLLKRIKEFGKISGKAYVSRFGEESKDVFEKERYDFIFGCLDNLGARFDLSRFAQEFEIPYIDGGTSPFMGSVSSYFPGKTPCIKCKKGLRKDSSVKASCVEEILPSVIIPNIVTGSLMVGEALKMIEGIIPEKKVIYDSLDPRRIYLSGENPSSKDCPCS